MSPTPISSNAPGAHPRVLVTGGRGRVAKAIREDLGREHWNITACSRVAEGDLVFTDEFMSDPVPLNFDTIVHCAWSSVPASAGAMGKPASSKDVQIVQQWIARLQTESVPPLFVFISTGAVYGEAQGRPSCETDETRPKSEYAESKLFAEHLLLKSGLPVCILRVAPLYGLQLESKTKQGVISHLVSAALNDTPFQQWGADTVKDYLHRTDFCNALRSIVAHRLQGDVWNLGSGTSTHLTQLIDEVRKASGKAIELSVDAAPEWDVRDNRLDISKLWSVIEWRPAITLSEGIASEVKRLRG